MTVSPDTLLEEDKAVRVDRENRTGVIGKGLYVICNPYPDEPEIFHEKHRAACLAKPYGQQCLNCGHGNFTLIFQKPDPAKRLETVQCPSWENGYHGDVLPDSYRKTDTQTCAAAPFPFCHMCPSRSDLDALSIDKGRDGWYSRWLRFTKDD